MNLDTPSTVSGSRPLPSNLGAGRRRHERHAIDAVVEVSFPCTASGVALNLSRSGLRVMIDQQVRPGARLTLVLKQGHESFVFHNARAVWARPFLGGCVVGLDLDRRRRAEGRACLTPFSR